MHTQKTYALFVLVCAIFGSTFLAISLGLKHGASPLFFAALRFATAGGVMLLVLRLANRTSWPVIGSLVGRASILSLFLTVGTFGCMFVAQTRVDSGLMARLDATGPIVTALFAALLLGKKLSRIHFLAFVVGTTGSFLIASPVAETEPLYLIVAAGSVLFYAIGNVLYPLLFHGQEDPVLISALQALLGGLILMLIALPAETIRFPLTAMGPFLFLTLLGSIVGHTATLILVRDAGPVFASGWLYVAPVVASVLGMLVLDETLTTLGLLGTLLALAGVFILGRAEMRADRAPPFKDKQQRASSWKSRSTRV